MSELNVLFRELKVIVVLLRKRGDLAHVRELVRGLRHVVLEPN